MSFLWRCGEAVLNFNLAKLPWEGSALSLIPGFPHGASAWPWLGPLSKAARWEKKLWGKQVNWSCRRSGCRQGKIAEKGTVSSSRTRRETHQSCKLGNSQVGKKKAHRRWELSSSSSTEFLMLSSGACSHVILLWILGNKSLPCPLSISCLQSIFSCPDTVTTKGYTSQPFLYFFFQISPLLCFQISPAYPWV